MKKITVVIPTLNAENYIENLLNRLTSGTIVPDEIIVIDSESTDRTVDIIKKLNMDIIRIIPVKRSEFNHGTTRNIGITRSSSEYILFLTQDALPRDNVFLEKMINTLLSDDKTAAVGARHIPRDGAKLREKYSREFSYKNESKVCGKSDVEKYGIKAINLSDCAALYRKDVLIEMGLFEHCLIAEDMLMAAKMIEHGYKIAYNADAPVIHSHNYSLKEQYKRNFDTGANKKLCIKTLGKYKAESEGIKYAKAVLSRLLKGFHVFAAIRFVLDCAVRLLAFKRGYNFEKLTKEQVLKRTSFVPYWDEFFSA